MDVRHREPRHGGRLSGTRIRRASRTTHLPRQRSCHPPFGVLIHLRQRSPSVLRRNDVSYEIRANTGYSEGAQNDWVEQTLADHRSDPAIDFIACFFHHCAYGTRAHGSEGGVRAAWTKLFDRYEVGLVLQGHNHVFERTDPIRAGNSVKVAPDNAVVYPDSDGTVYYTVGSGGRPRYAFREGEHETYRGNEISDTAVSDGYVWTEDGGGQDEVSPL